MDINITHSIPQKDQDILKKELRIINSRILLPLPIFNAILKFIDNEPFELMEGTIDYLNNLTESEKPDMWPKKLYDFLKKEMLAKLI